MGPLTKAFGYITSGLKYSANIQTRSFHSTRVLKVDVSMYSSLYENVIPYLSNLEIPELLNITRVEFRIAVNCGLKLLSYSQQPISLVEPGMLDYLRYIDSRERGSLAYYFAREKIQEALNLDLSITETVKRDLLYAKGQYKDISFINRTLSAKFD